MIYLLAGKISGGKTSLIHALMQECDDRRIAYNPRIVTDSVFLTGAVDRDHQVHEGSHHKHKVDEEPHAHPFDPEHEYETFINTHPMMQHLMNEGFMTAMGNVRRDGIITFAEMAVGGNGIPGNPNDYSAKRIVDEMRRGTLPRDWVRNIGLFVHIDTPYHVSVELNNERLHHTFRPGADVTGEMSRAVPPEVMPFTRHDDTHLLEDYLRREHGLGRNKFAYVPNDGTGAFFETGITTVLEHMNHRQPEGNVLRRKEK